MAAPRKLLRGWRAISALFTTRLSAGNSDALIDWDGMKRGHDAEGLDGARTWDDPATIVDDYLKHA
jgi:hypothetical protein